MGRLVSETLSSGTWRIYRVFPTRLPNMYHGTRVLIVPVTVLASCQQTVLGRSPFFIRNREQHTFERTELPR
ncbi:hypothetical protein ACFL5O_09165 [Myxococcota bacterium]